MGMFDYVICRVDLPGSPPDFAKADGHQFQSKSLDCDMSVYEITEDKRLLHVSGIYGGGVNEFVDETLTIDFYTGNARAGFFCTFTQDGEDFETVEYQATFVDGLLTSLIETEHKREPALSMEIYRQGQELSKYDTPDIDMTEPEVGAKLYLWWGGQPTGYAVTLAAKTSQKWAVVSDDDNLELIHASDLGHLIFNSEKDAQAANSARQSERDREIAFYKSKLDAKD